MATWRTTQRHWWAWIPAIALLISACGGGQTAPASAPSAVVGKAAPQSFGRLVVGTGIDVAYGAFVAAVRKGFFKQNGIDAELKIFQSGVEAVTAVVTGQADIAGGGGATLIQAASKGGDVKFVGTYEFSNFQTGVVATAAVKVPKDFEGRRVCTQANSDSELFFYQYMARYGIDKAKVIFKNVQYQQLPVALSQNECDIIFSQEPAITRALSTVSGSHVMERGGENGIHPLYVHAIVNKRLYSDPAFAEAVVKSMIQAGDWANIHQDEMAQLINTDYKIPLEDAKRYVGYFRFDYRFDKDVRDDITNTAQFLLERKLIDQPFDSPKFLDDRFLKTVAPERL